MIDTIIIASSYCIVVEKATLESLQALTKSCFQKAAIYALFRYNSSLKRSVTSSVTFDNVQFPKYKLWVLLQDLQLTVFPTLNIPCKIDQKSWG